MAHPAIDEHYPDRFTIICCNDGFQLALDHNTIKILLRVCKRARPLLSSKMPRFHRWCQSMELLNLEGHLRIGLTPSDQIALSLHFEDQAAADRSWLVAQADQGNAPVSYLLARVLQSENDTEADDDDELEENAKHQQIFHHLKRAAKASHSMAQFHLAECYLNGRGVKQDFTKAVELYRRLADHGISQAQIALGGCYENGEGVDQEYNTAIEWYSKAADQGSEDGRHHIVFLQGWLSFIGHDVEQSEVNALNHWQEVSTQSTDPIIKPIATHMVGWMHYLGRGTVRDEPRGVRIIRENKSDRFKLGESESLAAYGDANSTSPVARKLFQFCQLGSDRDWLCKHFMALCLHHGFGTTQDRMKAACVFEQLANDGHSDSQLRIGKYLHWGLGVLEDRITAFEWYSKSADQGNSYGQWMTGVCYYWGYGVTKDFAKAFEWYRRSAEQGNRYGQDSIGRCYKHGEGVPEDIDTAVLWYHKSADQGHKNAIERLKELGEWH